MTIRPFLSSGIFLALASPCFVSAKEAAKTTPITPHHQAETDSGIEVDFALYGTSVYHNISGDAVDMGLPAEEWSLQLLEPSLYLIWGDYSLTAVSHLESDSNFNDWTYALEELYLQTPWAPWDGKFTLGLFRVPWGVHNKSHLHHWDFVEQSLMHSRFLGEEGLIMQGASVQWQRNRVGYQDELTIALGESYSTHSHAHGESHNDFGFNEEDLEPGWDGKLASLRIARTWNPSRQQSFQLGLSALYGNKESSNSAILAGLDASWMRRFDSIESLQVNLEAGVHRFRPGAHDHHEDEHHDEHEEDHHEDEHHDEHEEDHHDDHDEDHHDEHEDEHHEEELVDTSWQFEPGISLSSVAKINSHLDVSARAEWVGGTSNRPERFRFSPAVTWYPREERDIYLRTQYSYGTGSSLEDHRFLVQFGFSWGNNEK